MAILPAVMIAENICNLLFAIGNLLAIFMAVFLGFTLYFAGVLMMNIVDIRGVIATKFSIRLPKKIVSWLKI